MDIKYAEIISSVNDWFGVIALIIVMLGVLFYKISSTLSATFKFAALALLLFAFMPVVYIKLYSELHAELPAPIPEIKKTVNNSDTQVTPVVKPKTEDYFYDDEDIDHGDPEDPDDFIMGCGRIYNLLPGRGDGFLSVRRGPGAFDTEIGRLVNNEIVDILGAQHDRLHILYRDNRRGWVHRNWVMQVPC